jgi:hypothetical protein
MDSKTKVVKIKENDLVNLIENIVKTTVAEKKAEWLAEQKSKTSTLEETIVKIVKSELKK